MNGPTVVLTGATSGIGEAAARLFAATACRLIIHGPESRDRIEPLLTAVSTAGNAELHYARVRSACLGTVPGVDVGSSGSYPGSVASARRG
ncbi:hypothetical protein ACFVOR_24570 [Streptomyces sp. NPDC057837]|uniref:hypothetical protein n=1 Tax=Streptomyces sp. NPDC057837 TaxID=3346260 RepID=UPI00369823FC